MATHQCQCGTLIFVNGDNQSKCANCGRIHQRDPMTGEIMVMNARTVTTSNTLPLEQ